MCVHWWIYSLFIIYVTKPTLGEANDLRDMDNFLILASLNVRARKVKPKPSNYCRFLAMFVDYMRTFSGNWFWYMLHRITQALSRERCRNLALTLLPRLNLTSYTLPFHQFPAGYGPTLDHTFPFLRHLYHVFLERKTGKSSIFNCVSVL